MPSSGSGIGVPVTTTAISTLEPLASCALSLSDYANIIGYDECAFFGVAYDGQIEYDCRMFWTEWQRLDVYRALVEAQQILETELRYPLCPTWVIGTPEEYGEQRYVDIQPSGNPLLTKWGFLIASGVRAEATLASGITVTYTVEPAQVGPFAATINDVAEVKVYYPGSDREIAPIRKTYSGGMLTIHIPRCRLVSVPNTIDEGVAYEDLSNFLTTVDVRRIYNDPSIGGVMVTPHACVGDCSLNGCVEYTQTACMYIRDHRLGIVEIVPATYGGGGWTRNSSCTYQYIEARLNYYCGLRNADVAMKNAIVRLAHARMAAEPCGCEIVQRLWERDRHTPDGLSRERLNCRFGTSDGAWAAYQLALSRKLRRISVF
jgi:hypothetical protein